MGVCAYLYGSQEFEDRYPKLMEVKVQSKWRDFRFLTPLDAIAFIDSQIDVYNNQICRATWPAGADELVDQGYVISVARNHGFYCDCQKVLWLYHMRRMVWWPGFERLEVR